MSPSTDAGDQATPVAEFPTVSVLVPTRDRPVMLRRAVASILGQSYPGRIECTVVFDQSDPQPIDVQVNGDRSLNLVRNDRKPGLAGARNTGILAATGEFIAFCDDDDEWLPDKLTAQVECLAAHPTAVVCGCHITLLGPDGPMTRAGQTELVTFKDLLASRVSELHPSTVVARRDAVINAVGLVDEQIPGGYAEDYDWLLRGAKLAPIPLVPKALVNVTWQTGSMFAGRWQMISDAVQYLMAKHPEFAESRAGTARLEGQIAFASAALGKRREAGHWARRALTHDPLERRAYLALAVSAHLINTDRLLALAHRRGRGI